MADAALWDATRALSHIRLFARARRVSPWAMLGAVLARLDCTVPPNVVLPPIVGSYGSLNTFVGIVAQSGGGKGAAERASREGVDVGDVFESSIGSGEGLLHLFAKYDKDTDGIVMHRDAVLLSVPEVDSLTALGGRQGATLLPTLRSAFTGEMLAPGYANREKALRLEDHSYRLALVMGIQPGRAGDLLADADGGTPQRFLWLPGTDPDAPDTPPKAPEPWIVPRQEWPGRLTVLPVDQRAKDRIVRERAEVLRGTRQPSHTLFVRLKIAALLAILDGRRAVTRDDWSLAGHVITVSETTRQSVANHLAATATAVSRERGRLQGEQRAAAAESEADATLRRVCQWVLRRLTEHPEQDTRGDINRAARSTDRDLIDAALEALTDTGMITLADKRYRLKSATP